MTTRGSRFSSSSSAHLARGRAVVGNIAYHTVGEREAALAALSLAYTQAYADIGAQVGYLPYAGNAERIKAHPSWYTWWQASAIPLFTAWEAFRSARSAGGWTGSAPGYVAYGENFNTGWNEYEDWAGKLAALRGVAQSLGMRLSSPPPPALPTTLVEDVKDFGKRAAAAAGGAGSDLWLLARVAVYGALGIGAAIAIGSLASNLKSGKDPASNYFALANRRRR